VEFAAPISTSAAEEEARHRSRRLIERAIKYFFGGNAIVAVVVLALITIFLFREGFGFFGENLRNLRLYRTAGLEYVDIIRAQAEEHSALTRSLNQIRLREFKSLTQHGLSSEQAQTALGPFDQFATAFSDAGDELNGLVSDLNDEAMGLKEAIAKRDEMVAEAERLARAGQSQAAAQVVVPRVNQAAAIATLRASAPTFRLTSSTVAAKLGGLLNNAPRLTNPRWEKQFRQWKSQVRTFVATLPGVYQQLENWDPTRPVPWYRGSHGIFVWARLDHSQFLAGLVRHPAIVGRLDHGLCGRTNLRSPDWRCRGDLRERNRGARREAPDQTLHRIHCRDSVGCVGIFRHCRRRRGDSRCLAVALAELDFFFPDQRTPECVHRRNAPRVDGHPDNLHAFRRCTTERAPQLQGGILCTRRKSPSDHRTGTGAGVSLRNNFGDFARVRPGYR
jgi:hypothetical protein